MPQCNAICVSGRRCVRGAIWHGCCHQHNQNWRAEGDYYVNPYVPEGRGEWRIHRDEWNSEGSGIPTVGYIALPPADAPHETVAAAEPAPAPVEPELPPAQRSAGLGLMPPEEGPLITPDVIADISSSDPARIMEAFNILKNISTEAHVEEFMRTHLIYNMHTYIDKGSDIHKFRALWVLTNVTAKQSEAGTQFVFKHPGLLQSIINCLSGSPEINVLTQALWCLGNIAGSGAVYAEQINSYGVQYVIARSIQSSNQLLSINALFLLMNLSRYMNRDQATVMMRALAPVSIADLPTVSAVCDYLIGLDRLYDKMEDMYFADPGQITSLLASQSASIRKYALTLIGSVVASDNRRLIDTMVTPQVIQALYEYLVEGKMMKEVLWTLSNCAADKKCSEMIVSNLPLLTLVYEYMGHLTTLSTEAAYVVANLVTNGSANVLYKVIDSNGFVSLVNCIEAAVPHMNKYSLKVNVMIEGVERVLMRVRNYELVKPLHNKIRDLLTSIESDDPMVNTVIERCMKYLGGTVVAPANEVEGAAAAPAAAVSILSPYVPSAAVKTAIDNIRKNKGERWISAANLVFSAADVAYLLGAGYAFHISGCVGFSDACLRLCGPK